MIFDKIYYREYHKELRQKYITLLGGKCVSCGSENNLDFDHINPNEKLYNIGKILHYKENFVLDELKKCQLLCRVCHLEKTSLENKDRIPWNKSLQEHGSLVRYVKFKCRCEPCRKAKSDWRKLRTHLGRSA